MCTLQFRPRFVDEALVVESSRVDTKGGEAWLDK